MILRDIQSYLDGKNIAVVGNSNAIFGKRYGKHIDAHDCVIRMGLFLGKGSDRVECLGKRVDIWASNASWKWRDMYFKRLSDIKCILILFPYHRPFETPPNGYRGRAIDYWHMKKVIKSKPSTGCLVLHFLTKYMKYKSLSLYGIDNFKEDPWTWETAYPETSFTTVHEGDKERQFFDKLVREKGNITWYQ